MAPSPPLEVLNLAPATSCESVYAYISAKQTLSPGSGKEPFYWLFTFQVKNKGVYWVYCLHSPPHTLKRS